MLYCAQVGSTWDKYATIYSFMWLSNFWEKIKNDNVSDEKCMVDSAISMGITWTSKHMTWEFKLQLLWRESSQQSSFIGHWLLKTSLFLATIIKSNVFPGLIVVATFSDKESSSSSFGFFLDILETCFLRDEMPSSYKNCFTFLAIFGIIVLFHVLQKCIHFLQVQRCIDYLLPNVLHNKCNILAHLVLIFDCSS